MPEIKFGTKLHQRVLEALVARIDMSESDMQNKHKEWDEAEKDFVFHMAEKDADNLRKSARDAGNPQYTTIEVPYTYGQAMTAHTYLSSVFLSRSPILQFAGRHGEPEMHVQAVEALMDYQTQIGGHVAPYYVWLHDGIKYGVGIVGDYYERERHIVSEEVEEPVTLFGSPVPGKTETKMRRQVIEGYEGNRLFNVRPYDAIPDTRVPLSQLQKGEFFGRKVPIGWNTMVKRKNAGQYFNVDETKARIKLNGGTNDRRASIVTELELPEENTMGSAHHSASSLVSTLPGIELVVELIPREWGLGSSEDPEKWIFTIIDKKIIVEAQPQGRWHNKFPFEVVETEIEGYGLTKRGMFEIGRPMNDVMTWLFNSHFYAVRKTVNGDIVYDPSRVVANDILNANGTGRRIRVKPVAYGQDVRSMIHVLQGGADVTGTHMRDTEIVGGLLQRIMGVNDNMTGAVNPGGRKTATEIRTSTGSSVNRMKTLAEYISAASFAPLSQRLLQTSQQMYRGEKKFKIVGDLAWFQQQGLPDPATGQPIENSFVSVDPSKISGFYDFQPVDGSLPLDRFAMVNMWGQLFAQIKAFPEVAKQYNMADIFAWVAQLGGIKNIKQFRINVLPPGVNPSGPALVGENGGRGNNGADRPGGTRGGETGGPAIPLPRQIPGVGPSG